MEQGLQEKVIFHIDVNSAYLSWEAVHRLSQGAKEDLREIPSAVGGDISTRHGVILAKSQPARQFHVQTGESIVEALRKCPQLTLVQPNHELYQKYSRAFMDILREYSPAVEQYSVDEAFMDMTGMELLFGTPWEAAVRIKDRIREELGFTVNVGISNNRLLAKMASDFEKPDKVHTLFPEEIERKMWKLPVRELFFVGRSTEKKLKTLGIHTIGQLAGTDKELLKQHLKKHGEIIWNFANGIAVADVAAEEINNKGFGNSTTLPFDVEDGDTAKMILLSLAETVGRRLRSHGARAEVVAVQIRYSDMTGTTHQRVLADVTDVTNDIYQTACRLFDESWDKTPIRLLGIQAGKVAYREDGRQMSLFGETEHEKLEKLDKAMDQIRERYGNNAVMRASFLAEEKPVEHLSPGIVKDHKASRLS